MSLTFAAAPRISLREWTDVLTRFNSPVVPVAAECYGICVSAGIDPCVALAFVGKESTFLTRGRSVGWNSWGNMRHPEDMRLADPYDERLGFATYPNIQKSLQDWCLHIRRRYIQRGLNGVMQAIAVYAPAFENDVEQYRAFITQHCEAWIAEDHPTMQTTGYADRDDLLPVSTDTHPDGRTGAKLTSFGAMVIHETANESPDATAAMHHNYWMPGGSGALLSSVQFVTDAVESIQLIPVDEQAEHAGDVVGNTTGVGIEICVNSRAGFPAACYKAAVIVAKVLKAEGKTPQDGVTIRKHGSYPGTTHTHCPQHLNAGDWGVTWVQFVDMVKAAYAAANGTSTPAPTMRFLTATVVSNVRTGPGTQYPIATVMHAGETAGFDSEKVGESIQGNNIWLHRGDERGFVFSGLLVEGT